MKKLITKRRIFCLAVVVAIIVVPFLYSYFYLGAFWDPYSKLEKLPVAVVNKDQGAEVNGTDRNLGKELCDRLKEDGTLKFVFTDEADAKKGTEGSDYYATLTIPADFSADIASANSDDKQTATITYSPNEKRNFLASQILNRAVLEVEEETRATVDKELVQTLADNINEVPDQLTELQDGLGKLSDGSSDLLDGTNTLADGIDTLYDGTKTLLDGTNTLADGTKTFYNKFGTYKTGVASLQSGTDKLATGAAALDKGIGQVKAGSSLLVDKTKNIGQITTGAKTLAEGTKTFDTSLTQYTTGVNALISNVSGTSTFLAQYVKANPSLLKDPTFAAFMAKMADPTAAQSLKTLMAAGPLLTDASTKLVAGSEQLSAATAGLPDLNTALTTLDAGIAKTQSGASELSNGATTLDKGVATLNTATGQLYDASGDIADGAAKLNNGAKDLKEGAADLSEGAGKLSSGASDLKDGINTAKDGVDTAITDANDQVNKLDGMAEFASKPVSVEQENVTTIANYGTAFAPYFMSLSLWVGALILFVGIYLDTEGKFKILSRESNHKLARSFMFLIIGFLQAITLALVVLFGLGLEVDNVLLFYASVCLVSMVFIAIVQFLIVHLKSVGKLLSVVMLILQLTSCGGTFPMELVPKFFGILYPWMPMTYSVALFKQAITDTDTDAVLYNGGVLFGILIAFMALTIILSSIKSRHSQKVEAKLPVLE